MIGITETYDPCYVPDWDKKLLDANIIISKELTDDMIKKLVANQDKIIFHHTVTGLGGTVYEPNVHNFQWECDQARSLLIRGFPLSHYVLRIDPIIPKESEVILEVLKCWQETLNSKVLTKLRCRVSMIDMYKHVKDRMYEQFGMNASGFEHFIAPKCEFERVEKFLSFWNWAFDFECCAEPNFTADFIEHVGCASNKDMKILGLPDGELPEKPQRKTCLCLAKKQILGVKPRRCPHQCLYCFWRD